MKHKDERGIIEDLKVGKDWSVTYITMKKGSVRGNHYHNETVQKDYILSGKLESRRLSGLVRIADAGETIIHLAGKENSHAYKALEDTEFVSISRGKRIGENYEEDTFRLSPEEKLI